MCDTYAVIVENVTFGYNLKQTVLTNLSTKIEKGEIFALLGSNGCGKTTLLKLILGSAMPDRGWIRVFGQMPGHKYSNIPGPDIGHMPQDIALTSQFTIEENMIFFAKLFRMNSQQFEERFKYLTQLLNLCEKGRRIDELSGGQQRLVSMAVALIHRPKLIILDEPTVGVDPILRNRIWSYLEETCHENGSTVIITTHYIEEAKRASNVAFIKSGTILRQCNPQKLMNEYKCQTLEKAYLHLWLLSNCKPEQNIIEEKSEVISEIILAENTSSKLTDSDKILDFWRILALIWRFNLRIKKRPIFSICFIALPFIALFSLYLSVGHLPHNIPVAVHSEEAKPMLSQQFIDSIGDKLLDINQYETKVSAIDSLLEGKNAFGIFFPKNFTNYFKSRFMDPFEKTMEELNGSEIKLYVDPTRVLAFGLGLQYLAEVLQQFVIKVSISLGLNPNAFTLPLTIEQPVYGSHPITGQFNEKFRVNYEYLAPAFLIVTCNLSSVVFSAFVIILNRRDSQMSRFFSSGGQPLEVIISIYISILFFITIQVLLLLVCVSLLFNIKQEGSYVEVYMICVMQSVLGLSYGVLISLIFREELTILVAIGIFMLPMYFVSGLFWPLEGIPSYFRYLSDWTPISKPIDSLRSIMLKGWNFSHPNVSMGYAVTITYTMLASIVSVIIAQIHHEPFI